jgi:glutamyl-tRNA synthetase
VNPNTKFESSAVGDANMRTLQKGDIIQLERKGYFIVDAPLLRPGKPIVLLSIPDGRVAKK